MGYADIKFKLGEDEHGPCIYTHIRSRTTGSRNTLYAMAYIYMLNSKQGHCISLIKLCFKMR